MRERFEVVAGSIVGRSDRSPAPAASMRLSATPMMAAKDLDLSPVRTRGRVNHVLLGQLDRHLAEQVAVIVADGDRWWRDVGHELEIGVAPELASADMRITNSANCTRP